MLNSEIKDAVRHVPYAHRPMETMGDRIKLLRDARGLTQEALAKRVGVSKSAVSQWEDGSTKNIKLQTFLSLVEELRTDAPYLIFGPDRAPAGGQANKAAWRSR